jgi:hypothetical protein
MHYVSKPASLESDPGPTEAAVLAVLGEDASRRTPGELRVVPALEPYSDRAIALALRTLVERGLVAMAEERRAHPENGKPYLAAVYSLRRGAPRATGRAVQEHSGPYPGQPARTPRKGRPGRITSALTVWCADCDRHERSLEDEITHAAAARWRRLGWTASRDLGWICPDCTIERRKEDA